MNNPKVSVIIPVYNTEAYVEQTLRSIMGQTLRDIELIVINDGSTDGSLSALERIATGDDCIRLYTQPNKGLSQTCNAGIDRARGEFIYFMDSDDLLEPTPSNAATNAASQTGSISYSSTPKASARQPRRRMVRLPACKNISTEVCDGTDLLRRMLALHCYRASACLSFIRTAYLRGLGLRFYRGYSTKTNSSPRSSTWGQRAPAGSSVRSSSGAYTGIRSWDAGSRAATSKAIPPYCAN